MTNKNNSRFCLIFFASILQYSFANTPQEDIPQKFSYAEIAAEYIPSLGLTAPTSAPQSDDKADFNKPVFLSDYEKYVTTFGLLEKSITQPQPVCSSPITILMQDLNIFSYKSKDASQRSNSLLGHLKGGNVVTLLGEACLSHILAHPLSDVQELQSRQKAVTSFIDSSPGDLRALKRAEHYATFETALENYKQQEIEFLTCYKDPTKVERDHINKLFFQKFLLNKFNANEYALGLAARTGDAMVSVPFLGSALLGAITAYATQQSCLKLHKDNKEDAEFYLGHKIMSFSQYFQKAAKDEAQMCNPLHYVTLYEEGTKKMITECSKAGYTHIDSIPVQQYRTVGEDEIKAIKISMGIGLGIAAAITLYKLYTTYSLTNRQIETHKIDAYMQRKLISCATLVQTFDTLMQHVKNDPALDSIFTTWQKDCSSKSKDFNKLVEMLHTPTFKGGPSFFSNLGRVRAAYTLMMKTRDEFGDMARFVGLCDAYLAIAKLYIKHQDTPNKYSFVEFITRVTPCVKLNGFWNPVLDPSKAVGNSLELGAYPQALLVTGSNSGGKSTIMTTGLTSTILLAQTLTIAPAELMILAPFDYIATSLKIQDNIASGKSHFVAETQHAASLVRTIENLDGKKAFIAVDELFEGTTAEVGEKGLYDFGLALLKQNNLCFVIVTQYQGKPTLLEEASHGKCRNARIDIVKNEDGTLFRPYKLEFGVSQVPVGTELLEEAFSA